MTTQLFPGVMTQAGGGVGVPGSVSLAGELRNFYANIVGQLPVAATRTYLTGSQLSIPQEGFKVGTKLRWKINMTKTAAGVATSTFDVAFGLAGTVADTAQVSFVKPVGTAAIDEAVVEIECLIASIGATGRVIGEFTLIHTLAATGHVTTNAVTLQTVSGAFDPNSGTGVGGANKFPAYVGLCLTTGAADAITITMVQAEAWYL
jgi:hypothetical protein